jgi:hypothetical protein
VKQRDFFGGDGLSETAGWLENCRQALQMFAIEVFNHEKHEPLGSGSFTPRAGEDAGKTGNNR